MVDVKSLWIHDTSFMGVHLHMPGYPLYFIISTKTILTSDQLNILHFHKGNHVAVVLVSYSHGFQEMLQSNVIALNEEAKHRGVQIAMNGEEALMLCEKKKTQS